MDNASNESEINNFLEKCYEFARLRSTLSNMIIVPDKVDIEKALSITTMKNIDTDVVRDALIDTALNRIWEEPTGLYTGNPVCDRYDMRIYVPSNIEVYPIIEVRSTHPCRTNRPDISWHRNIKQLTTKDWYVELDVAHRIGNGFAFIELNKPVERQEHEDQDGIIHIGQIVGFCVEDAKIIRERL